ncbi:MAG: hypothetical protein AMK69_28590 [Nitrospira bacterium SG8_3]|nr:MAG: hypothetical protein AMK69_28590 [Nitrospira bacterium SG8_3]
MNINRIVGIGFVILFLIILIPAGTEGQEITSRVTLYEHFDPINHEPNSLLTWPAEEDQQQAVEQILYFEVGVFGHNYDLTIKGSTIVHFEQWFSSDIMAFIDINFILSDNNETEILSGRESYEIDFSPTQCELDVQLPGGDVVVNQSHRLFLIIEITYPPSYLYPSPELTAHTGLNYTSGVSLIIKDPIRVQLHVSEGHAADDPDYTSLHIFALFITPFGGENIEDYDLGIDGPTDERDLRIAIAEYPPSTGSRDWIWDLQWGGAKPGTYTIHLNATTRQGVHAEDSYEYVLENKDEPDDFITWSYAILLVILIICIVGVFIYKKRGTSE